MLHEDKTSILKVGLGKKEEGRKERIERKKKGKKQKEAQRNRKNKNFTIPYCYTRT